MELTGWPSAPRSGPRRWQWASRITNSDGRVAAGVNVRDGSGGPAAGFRTLGIPQTSVESLTADPGRASFLAGWRSMSKLTSIALLCMAVQAQTVKPTFEVASVKPATPLGPRGMQA